jgi:hypothetical protein
MYFFFLMKNKLYFILLSCFIFVNFSDQEYAMSSWGCILLVNMMDNVIVGMVTPSSHYFRCFYSIYMLLFVSILSLIVLFLLSSCVVSSFSIHGFLYLQICLHVYYISFIWCVWNVVQINCVRIIIECKLINWVMLFVCNIDFIGFLIFHHC